MGKEKDVILNMEVGQENKVPQKGSELPKGQETQVVGQPELQQSTRNEQYKLAEARTELAGIPQPVAEPPPSQTNSTLYEPKGFKQAPLRTLRNIFFYPTTEANFQIAVGTGMLTVSAAVISSAVGHPEVGGVVALVGEALLVGELGSLFLRKRSLSEFFRVHKNRVTEEKVLSDGTVVDLDDSVGELHMSGLTKIWRLNSEKDKTKRALILMNGVLQGLVNLADKAENDSWFKDIRAFKGTSFIVNPRIAEKFGFQVDELQGNYRSFVSRAIRALDRKLALLPKEVGKQNVRIAWISRESLIAHKGVIKEEFDKVQRALVRRVASPAANTKV